MDRAVRRMRLTPPVGFPAPGEPTAGRAALDRIVAGVEPAPPFVTSLGLPCCAGWDYGFVYADFTPAVDVTVAAGVVFGGWIAGLIDQQAGLAMMSVLPDGAVYLTSKLEVEFLAPFGIARTRVEAEVVELTDRRAICTVLVSQDGAPVSRGRVTQALRRRP